MSRTHCRNLGACVAKKADGHCRGCSIARVWSDPELLERRRAGIRRSFEDPAVREAAAKRAVAAGVKARQDPAFRDWLVQNGKRLAADVLNDPGVRAKTNAPEVRKRAGKSLSDTRLSWCPETKRAEYMRLQRVKHIPAAQARAMIEDELAKGSPEAEARRIIDGVNRDMRAKAAREKAQAY